MVVFIIAVAVAVFVFVGSSLDQHIHTASIHRSTYIDLHTHIHTYGYEHQTQPTVDNLY